MKRNQEIQFDAGVTILSIPEAEEKIEEALEELAYSTDASLAAALRFLAPAGYQPIVELCGENGRSKRRNASASSWNPEEDEVRIYFERIGGEEEEVAPRPSLQLRGRGVRSGSNESGHGHAAMHDGPEMGNQLAGSYGNGQLVNGNVLHAGSGELDEAGMGSPELMDERIRELCATLAEAERGGHAFIALKWFRDSFLPRKSFGWNQNAESRQLILAEAILRGVVMTNKIPNPKTPAYPTTTIRLNRAEAGVVEESQRFKPVLVQGEAMTATLDDDRGNR